MIYWQNTRCSEKVGRNTSTREINIKGEEANQEFISRIVKRKFELLNKMVITMKHIKTQSKIEKEIKDLAQFRFRNNTGNMLSVPG